MTNKFYQILSNKILVIVNHALHANWTKETKLACLVSKYVAIDFEKASLKHRPRNSLVGST